VDAPSAKFERSGNHLPALIIALAAGLFSIWCGTRWWPAFIPAGCFFAASAALIWAIFRPAVEVHDLHLRIGRETIAWNQIRRVDRTRWISPLVLYLTLLNERRVRIVYPGDTGSAQCLLLELRRRSKEALIDGVPYRRFWGDTLPSSAEPQPATQSTLTTITQAAVSKTTVASPKFRMIRLEDEEEIERMFQRLKTVGHLDPHADSKKNQPDR
jgi:Protein of unknown function (DUF3093)